jgi:hypothetical protein
MSTIKSPIHSSKVEFFLQTTEYKRTRDDDEFELIHDDVSLI